MSISNTFILSDGNEPQKYRTISRMSMLLMRVKRERERKKQMDIIGLVLVDFALFARYNQYKLLCCEMNSVKPELCYHWTARNFAQEL